MSKSYECEMDRISPLRLTLEATALAVAGFVFIALAFAF